MHMPWAALVSCLLTVPAAETAEADIHSFARPHAVRVRHVDLTLDVLFGQKVLKGQAVLTVERTAAGAGKPLVLDTRKLKVEKVEAADAAGAFTDVPFRLGAEDPIKGAPLTQREAEILQGYGALEWNDFRRFSYLTKLRLRLGVAPHPVIRPPQLAMSVRTLSKGALIE